MARSMALLNCRTLPGQLWARSALRASGENPLTFFLNSRLNNLTKWSAMDRGHQLLAYADAHSGQILFVKTLVNKTFHKAGFADGAPPINKLFVL